MASSLIICLSATGKRPPSIAPVFPNTTCKSTIMSSTGNNFFCPPNRCVSAANPSLLSKPTTLFLQTPLKHKKQDYSQISSVAASPSDLTQVSATLCFSLADLLDAIETESGYDSEVEEEEENLMKIWTVREIEQGVELKINMPGLGKEDVHVTLEETTLLIKAGKADENENPVAVINVDKTDEENDMMMNTMISFELDLDFLKLDEMKAEMKNMVF